MNELKKIHQSLNRGDIKRIAKELDVTAEFVSQVLRGVNKSQRVLTLAIEFADVNKKNNKELDKRIKEVLAK
jgi:flagellar basal body-associated protein FliL